MKLFVLQLWDFHKGKPLQAAYPSLEEARAACKDFIHLGKVKPQFIRTYEIEDMKQAIFELNTYGADQQLPDMGEAARKTFERNLAGIATIDTGF